MATHTQERPGSESKSKHPIKRLILGHRTQTLSRTCSLIHAWSCSDTSVSMVSINLALFDQQREQLMLTNKTNQLPPRSEAHGHKSDMIQILKQVYVTQYVS